MTATTREFQRKCFALAVDLLGGTRAAARRIDVSERTMRNLLNGAQAIHEGFLHDIAAALLAQAEACRMMERNLSPAFVTNLTAGQAVEDGRRTRRHRA